MPPRYAYWTILVDGQPTAFRSGALEDLMPTFNRLKEKQPTAEVKWFQNGQLWASRHDAQEFMRARGDRGRERDPRQSSDDAASPKPERAWNAKPAWKTRSSFSARDKASSFAKATEDKPSFAKASSFAKATEDKPADKSAGQAPRSDKPSFAKAPAYAKASADKPAWKPKGSFKPKEPGHSSGWGEKPGMKRAKDTVPEGRPFAGRRDDKPAWKPKGSPREQARATFRPKSYTPSSAKASAYAKAPSFAKASSFAKATEDKPEDKPEGKPERKPAWKPRGSSSPKPQASSRDRGEKLDWKPASAKASAYAKASADKPAGHAPQRRGDGPNAGFARSDSGDAPAKRKWVPKAEYKKSLGIEAKRDDKWRPGGEHIDPKQKYKDAKKAKWTRVKQTIRARSSKPRKRSEDK